VVTSPPVTVETGAMGREIESRQVIHRVAKRKRIQKGEKMWLEVQKLLVAF
jgi:hypothetical protein